MSHCTTIYLPLHFGHVIFKECVSISIALHEVPMETVDEGIAIPLPGHYCRGRQWGIQGEHNSCYLDATLFGLFALSSEFDTLLISHRGGPKGEEICNTLRTQIINPLRK